MEVFLFFSSSKIIHRTSKNDDSTCIYKHLWAARVHVHAACLTFEGEDVLILHGIYSETRSQ